MLPIPRGGHSKTARGGGGVKFFWGQKKTTLFFFSAVVLQKSRAAFPELGEVGSARGEGLVVYCAHQVVTTPTEPFRTIRILTEFSLKD